MPKLLVVEEVGGANFHGFSWVREDEIFVNFKLGNHKDESLFHLKRLKLKRYKKQ